MKQHTYFLLILLAHPINLLVSQSRILNFHQLTTEEGLSESTNAFIYTDSDKYTWIGSVDGLNRFDGKEVDVFKEVKSNEYSIEGINNQSSFFEDQLGNIWFGTELSINCYEKKSRQFHQYYFDTEKNKGVHYLFYIDNQDVIWGVFNGKLFQFNTLRKEFRLISDQFKNVIRAVAAENENGNIEKIFGYFWDYGPGFIEFDINDSTVKNWYDGVDGQNSMTLKVRQIIPVNSTEIYCSTDKGLLFLSGDPKSNRFPQLFPFPDDVSNLPSMVQLSNHIYLNTSKNILVFDRIQKTFLDTRIEAYNLDTKKSIENISEIKLGRDSILWLGVKGQGVYFANLLNTRSFSILRQNNIPEKEIQYLSATNSLNVLAVSRLGVGLNISTDKQVIGEVDLQKYFKEVKMPNGQFWAISNKGIGKKNLKSETYDWTFNREILYDILVIDEDVVLVGSNKGVSMIDMSSSALIKFKGVSYARKLFLDSYKRLWIDEGTGQLGVFNIDFSNLSLQLKKTVEEITFANDIVEDFARGIIWIGTAKGLVKVPNDQIENYKILTEEDGLPNQHISAMVIDSSNFLWFSSNYGITRYDIDGITSNQFRNFSTRDGLSSNEYSPAAKVITVNGDLWFGSMKGIDVIDPDIGFIGKAPTVSLKEFIIHKEQGDETRLMIENNKVKLGFNQNTFKIVMAGIEYTDPERNLFKIQLLKDGKVINSFTQKSNTSNFTNLPHGDYVFRAGACNAENICTDFAFELRIRIKPIFYKTWWFGVLMAFMLISIIRYYYVSQLREKQFQFRLKSAELEKHLALNQERERIANEMHDDIGGSLTTILKKSYEAKTTTSKQHVNEVVNRISSIAVDVIKKMRDLIWAMDPENDSAVELFAKIRQYTAQFLEDHQISYKISYPPQIPDYSLGSEIRYHLLLVVKELLHNIAKYAEAEEVFFQLQIEEGININVSDNGNGFIVKPNATAAGHYGLANCQKRIKTLHGQIDWRSQLGKGTTVIIQVPLPENVNESREA